MSKFYSLFFFPPHAKLGSMVTAVIERLHFWYFTAEGLKVHYHPFSFALYSGKLIRKPDVPSFRAWWEVQVINVGILTSLHLLITKTQSQAPFSAFSRHFLVCLGSLPCSSQKVSCCKLSWYMCGCQHLNQIWGGLGRSITILQDVHNN